MNSRVIIGVFDKHNAAGNAISALREASFKPESLSTLAADTDEYHAITAQLQVRQVDKSMMIFGIIGASIGAVVALYALLVIPGFQPSRPLTAALMGSFLGFLAGALAGVLIDWDRAHYRSCVFEGRPATGQVLIAVNVQDREERNKAVTIMEECGALEIYNRLAPRTSARSRQAKASS